jgi:hypothetical protein
MLGASAAGRERALACMADLDILAPVNAAGHWLGRFLRVLYDEPFVAVEPATGTAIRGRMSGISENFQLNVLLMDVFPKRGFLAKSRVSKAAVAVARGDGPQQIDETVIGAWDTFGWPALTSDGSLPRAGEPGFMEHAIWNEGTPADIPVFEEQRVIVLGPPSYTRTWQAQRDFARLRAGLSGIETLSRKEFASLVSRLAASPRRP